MQSLTTLQKPDLLAVPVAALLRDAILRWQFPPGERIVERQLASQWNISRAPLREAIRQLVAEGLLVVSPRRGAAVRDVSEKELSELFAVREMIEVNAVRAVAESATDADLARMQGFVDGMHAAAARHDVASSTEQGLAFHDELVRLARNETLIQIYDGIKLRFRCYQFLLATLPNLPQSSAVEHEKILAALRARDGNRASACVTQHLAHLISRFAAGKAHFPESNGRPSTVNHALRR